MKYFLHDSNAFNDEKITELYLRYGYEGLGLFYTLLEKLASQEKPMKTIVLKAQLKVGKKLEKCWIFMEEIELISSNNGDTFNKQLLNFSEKYNIKKEKNTKRISEWRKNQEDKENVTCYERVSNTPKVKESKVKESKEIYIVKIQKEFYQSLTQFTPEFDKTTLRDFYNYWSEPNKSLTKIKWQLERTWDTKKRLIRWTNNNFKKTQNQQSESIQKSNIPAI